MKKPFEEIIIIITTSLVILSLTCAFYAKTAFADTEEDNPFPNWQFNVTGLVETPLNLTATEIIALPRTTIYATIICVDFPNNIVMEGNWTGIKLKTVLEAANPSANAIKVAFYAADDYSTDLTIEAAVQDNVIIAYEKDGVTLNNLRLVVPDKWGYKWINKLIRIELLDYNFLGYWEKAGYPDEANVTTSSPSTNQDISPLPSPQIGAPSPSPTLPPATSPSPPPSPKVSTPPPPLTQSTPTPEPPENRAIPTETVYVVAVSLIAIILVGTLMFARKRRK